MKSSRSRAQTAQFRPAAERSRQVPVRVPHGAAATQHGALQAGVDQSSRMLAQRRVIEAAFGSAIQRHADGLKDEEPLQARMAPVARRTEWEEDYRLPVQGRFADDVEARPNLTGMPSQLRAGIESLSGMDMSDVRVHRNSGNPAQLNALAYAQGKDIHLGPGQEQHLPHEAWHVVQQAQGRVAPTRLMETEVAVNDDACLEHEADVMGARALQMQTDAGQAAPERPAGLQALADVPGAQAQFASGEGPRSAAGIERSPRMVAQRNQIAAMLGSPAQNTRAALADGATAPGPTVTAARSQPHLRQFAGTTTSAREPGIIQAIWKEGDSPDVMYWDQVLGGLKWFWQKSTNKMIFRIEKENDDKDIQKILVELSKTKRSYDDWIKEWKDYGWIDPDAKHKEAFSDYVDRIIRSYPPDSYIYIGLGASCDLILEYLKVKYGIESASIPISSANALPVNEDETWTAEQLTNLRNYIAETVGSKVINATDKQLLVMDVTSGGSSLRNICDALEAVLESSGKGPGRVHRLSLNTTVDPAKTRLKIPNDEMDAVPPLLEDKVKDRELSEAERESGVVAKGATWIPYTVFDEADTGNKDVAEGSAVAWDFSAELGDSDSDSDSEGAAKESAVALEVSADRSDSESDAANDKTHQEYEPSEYDMFIKGRGSEIGKKLDDMDYKKLGRIYEKIPMLDVMSGKVMSPAEFYNEKGHASIKRYAEKLAD
jgi:hypothetical protein